jgi:hypothetical protein
MLTSPMIEASTSQSGNLPQFLACVADQPRTYVQTMEPANKHLPHSVQRTSILDAAE